MNKKPSRHHCYNINQCLEQIDNLSAITKATDAINNYYFHTLNNATHRSDGFWNNFTEHFGAYTLYNTLPYSSSDIASSHNADHQECFIWGPFAPRPFGVFPMIAINYNIISDYHWDAKDEANCFCCLVILGDFEGCELCFPQLQIVVVVQPGQVVAFSSHFLLHDAKGNVNNPQQDLTDTKGLNNLTTLTKPKAFQIRISSASSDNRQRGVDLAHACQGLKAEDLLPNS
ncbi:17000_t:CDS:2 [Entrophospora sp. SA101]|nr:17000_t:CDS:2 [Entrophospora sp. SA101]